jgi:hypothetical protein
MIDEGDCGAIGGMKIGRGKNSTVSDQRMGVRWTRYVTRVERN